MFEITKPRFEIAKNSDGREYLGVRRGLTDYAETFPGGSLPLRPPFDLHHVKAIAEQAYELGRTEALKNVRVALRLKD